jgi:nitrate reductase cytochrome c-type subunit
MQKKIVYLSLIIFAGIVGYQVFLKATEKEIYPLTKSWEKAVPHQQIPEGLASLSAEQCGACHVKHYEEWQHSTHSHAWTDLQFQAELKKESSPFLCINCHIPLQNQQEFIVTGLIDGDIYQPVKQKNPHFDKKLQQEGINCASCHVRDNVVIGSTGTTKAPHATRKDPVFLSEKLCLSCHNAKAVVTSTLVCSFETGDEWKAGPYYGQKNCISCHMEPTKREIVAGFGERVSHLHYFAGSGIPKVKGAKTKVLNGLAIYPSKVEKAYSVNEEIVYNLKLKNEFAGHRVPSGDPERFFGISMELLDEAGKVVSQKTDRIGEKWEWYPAAKKISDNNLNPKEERTFAFSYKPTKKQNLTLAVKVTKNRLDKKSADYNKLDERYPLFITVFDEKYAIEVK